ncbi:hypothetical protein NDU88_000011 [Pleurodeles waltl]|uniref:Uncharacterized protein n=1 Tax=Pleurodeles waltl TaxID=8319 RepID=A0AAV7S4T2_PLEWA|nr:hypothetical protein NDU88_000011 [Pleurodeles waltl]
MRKLKARPNVDAAAVGAKWRACLERPGVLTGGETGTRQQWPSAPPRDRGPKLLCAPRRGATDHRVCLPRGEGAPVPLRQTAGVPEDESLPNHHKTATATPRGTQNGEIGRLPEAETDGGNGAALVTPEVDTAEHSFSPCKDREAVARTIRRAWEDGEISLV